MNNPEDTTVRYTKRYETRQYTEIIYYRDGEEFARDELYDDIAYDATPAQTMTKEDIAMWT
jgi:hypothetical protein